jgi:hypothetical protein
VLLAYSAFLGFGARLEPGFAEVPRRACCSFNKAMPRLAAAAIRRSQVCATRQPLSWF